MRLLLFAFVTQFFAELGDKTQLLTITFTAKYRIRDIVLGISLAAAVLNLVAVALGGMLSSVLSAHLVRLAAGFSFLLFALWTLRGQAGEEEALPKSKRPPCLAVAAAFFLAEWGDKTQLYGIALSAQNPGREAVVFLGISLGLLAANLVGIGVGLFLGKRLPSELMRFFAFAIFGVFGFYNILSGMRGLGLSRIPLALGGLAALFSCLSAHFIRRGKRRKKAGRGLRKYKLP